VTGGKWLVLAAALAALVLNDGDFGNIDTARRLQVSHSWWTKAPEVDASNEVGSGVYDSQGRLRAWYGMGQSLVLFPIDLVCSSIVRAASYRHPLDGPARTKFRVLLTSLVLASLTSAAAIASALAALSALGFSPPEALAGALTLLFGTTFFHYMQNSQENNLLLALFLTALWCALRWLTRRRDGWAIAAALASGMSLITRLPCLLDAAVIAALVLLTARRGSARFFAAFPPYLVFVVLDRWYQWERFGLFWTTHMGLQNLQRHSPGAPAAFPFGYPFWRRFTGALVSPQKSIFLYDPLLVASLALLIWTWRDLSPLLKYYAVLLAVAVLVLASFYATCVTFAGDAAWGDRFTATMVELLATLSGPLAVRRWRQIPHVLKVALALLACLSLLEQILSTILPVSAEILQRASFAIGQRAANVALLLRGDTGNPVWRGIPMAWRNWNYLPFHMRENYASLTPAAFALWAVLLTATAAAVTMAIRSAVSQAPRQAQRAA
jgi:hypothetical protein